MIKAVGLDLDNTLYDRSQVYEEVYSLMEQNVIKTNVSFPVFNKVFQQESYIEFQKFAKELKGEFDYKNDRITSTYRKLGKNITKEQALIFHALYLYYKERIKIRPGMEKLINYLQSKGKQIFILTNGPEEAQLKKLRQLDIEQKVLSKYLFVSEQLGVAKPNKKIFDKVESALELTKNEILYIGDDYETDVLGSLQNDWQVIFYNIDNIKINNKEIIQFQSDEQIYDYIKDII